MAQGDYVIEVKNLNKSFTNKRIENNIIDNISLNIKHGEFAVIAGRSGAGKSTLLNLIGGLERASSGSVMIDGKAIESITDEGLAEIRKNQIGFIFQDFNLLAGYTVSENIEIAIADQNLSKEEIKERIHTLLDEFGIPQKGDYMPKELSIGQQQRVAISRALINNPTLILADEPTGGVDHITAKEMADYLYSLNDKYNVTMIVTTHGVFPWDRADQTIFLKDGKISTSEECGF